MLRHHISPSPASLSSTQPPPSKPPVNFSPPLIAMVVTIITAFIIITYSRLLSRHCLHTYRKLRRWTRRRRRRRYVLSTSAGDIESPPHLFSPTEPFHVLSSPYGLDESIIKTIPLSIYTSARKSGFRDCAVCLLEFEINDYVRTLPACSHAFHVDCIDIWLRSHANCPLCRAGIFRADSPFTPLMAARIRPSLDDIIIEIESDPIDPISEETETEIEIVLEPNRRDFLLKRSYSFGFERNLGSPYRKSFWNNSKRSPFTRHRVFSFRYYRNGNYGMNGIKSPLFFRRRSMSGLFYPLSESNVRIGGSSRRSKSFASPMFMRSSRLRSGDPEALLSPERYNRR